MIIKKSKSKPHILIILVEFPQVHFRKDLGHVRVKDQRLDELLVACKHGKLNIKPSHLTFTNKPNQPHSLSSLIKLHPNQLTLVNLMLPRRVKPPFPTPLMPLMPMLNPLPRIPPSPTTRRTLNLFQKVHQLLLRRLKVMLLPTLDKIAITPIRVNLPLSLLLWLLKVKVTQNILRLQPNLHLPHKLVCVFRCCYW